MTFLRGCWRNLMTRTLTMTIAMTMIRRSLKNPSRHLKNPSRHQWSRCQRKLNLIIKNELHEEDKSVPSFSISYIAPRWTLVILASLAFSSTRYITKQYHLSWMFELLVPSWQNITKYSNHFIFYVAIFILGFMDSTKTFVIPVSPVELSTANQWFTNITWQYEKCG